MIDLYEIQPLEETLAADEVLFYLSNPDMLFHDAYNIHVGRARKDFPFTYFVAEGNTKLFACHLMGLRQLPIDPEQYGKEEAERLTEAALELYQKGVQTWRDLEAHITDIPNYL